MQKCFLEYFDLEDKVFVKGKGNVMYPLVVVSKRVKVSNEGKKASVTHMREYISRACGQGEKLIVGDTGQKGACERRLSTKSQVYLSGGISTIKGRDEEGGEYWYCVDLGPGVSPV